MATKIDLNSCMGEVISESMSTNNNNCHQTAVENDNISLHKISLVTWFVFTSMLCLTSAQNNHIKQDKETIVNVKTVNCTIKPYNLVTVCYANVDQLMNKRYELQYYVNKNNPDIIQLTEVLPKRVNPNFKVDITTDFNIQGYSLIHNENLKRGTVIYIKETLDFSPLKLKSKNTYLEVFWFTGTINSKKILLGCVYRNPYYANKAESTQELINTLKSIEYELYDTVLITGDFNYPDIKWTNLNEINCNSPEFKFLNCTEDLFLQQLIDKPTRHRANETSNILDLVFTNDDSFILNVNHSAPFGKSDHEIIEVTLNLQKPKDNVSDPKLNFYKTDFDGLKAFVSEQNLSNINNLSFDDSLKLLYYILNEGIYKFVPILKPISKDKVKNPPWMNKKALKCIKKKYHLYKKFLHNKSHYNYQRYIEIRNTTKRLVKNTVKEYERNIAKACKVNCKRFWKYVNSKLKRTTGVPNLKYADGNLTSSDKEKADLLVEFFESVFTKEDLNNLPELTIPKKGDHHFINDLNINAEEVKVKLNNLNINKSMGPDKIPSIILKNLSEELCEPLSIIFNKSLKEGIVPLIWKTAEITAIYKKDDKTNPTNYRPVSLTSVICKLLESIITDKIREYMENNDFFSNCQHGFRKHRSCVTQLLEVMNDFSKFSENNDPFDVIYLDFAKAFDTVPHQRLLIKLKAYGISGNLLNWIENFLTDRRQRVKVNSSLSKYTPVTSGIPQGSILGPLLFIIYINDLPECIDSICKIFADDTKAYDSCKKSASIQNDLFSLLAWSEKWQLYFNKIKCGVLHFGSNNPCIDYYIDLDFNTKLKTLLTEKDVGVTFSRDLKFN